jgi:ABC-type branched-subunit amino acid transport system permease subunit
MTTNTAAQNSTEVIELAPNFRIPVLLILAAIALAAVSWWLSGAIALRALALPIAILGLFLTVQTVLIRLQFTDQALKVLRSGKVILTFPYSEWINWEIFWSPVPILFYFKEINSIHFLPIIFDAKTLADCLHKYYPHKSTR